MKKIFAIITVFCLPIIGFSADIIGVVSDEIGGASNGAIDITLTGGVSPYTYSWVGPAGFTSTDEDLMDLAAGDYTVTVTDNYCGSLTYTFTVGTINNANLSESPFEFSIYPNPTSNFIYVKSNENIRIEIYDASGKLLIQKQNPSSIDISELASGSYVLKAISDKGIITRNILKQ